MMSTISNLQNLTGTLAINGTEATKKAEPQDLSSTVLSQGPQKADQASLSSLGALVAQATAAPDVRLDKVAALQQSIASGTYNVPASAVASKIVDSLLS